VKHLPVGQILVGDARKFVGRLPAASVDAVITSPPYFRLRNYQQPNQIGLETHVDEWVGELLLVARGLKRVLKPSGSLWLNLGDTFSRHTNDGALPKSLVLAPERLALAMIADGWILRSKVIWSKPNPMPTSIRDRLSSTWEVVYFFVRERQYYFNLDAIRVPHRGRPTKAHSQRAAWSVPTDWRGPSSGTNSGLDRLKASGLPGHPLGKNPGDVWSIPTAGYRGAHHAVYPFRLVERPLLATCPEKVCSNCGTPRTQHHRRKCDCGVAAGVKPGIVLDPFMGSGTTAIVAEHHGRDWLGIELNPDFAAMAMDRITAARAGSAPKSRTLTTEDHEIAA
jgi:site-specific DNA-methyltransferase (adenine-specific)